MEQFEVETLLRNLDRRVGRVEQFLPTLATKAELQEAIAGLATKEELREAIAPLATKAELQAAIAAAIAPLATKAEVRAEAVETRRYFDVVAASLRAEIRLVAEAVQTSNTKIDHLRVELKQDITGLDRRVTRLEDRGKRR